MKISLSLGLLALLTFMGCSSSHDERGSALASGEQPEPGLVGRDRVKIMDRTLFTDKLEPLRGASYWISSSTRKLHNENPAAHREYFRSLSKDYHVNVVRLAIYDQYQKLDPEALAELVDHVVDWAEEDGIYAIINWHNDYGGYTTHIDEAQMKRFWDYYASKYKDRKHVLFEGSNETVTDAAMQVKIYETIRKHAPDTHIILWTPPNTDKIDLDKHIRLSEAMGVSYQNASIGYHPYGGLSAHDRAIAWKNAGYTVVCTEVPTFADPSWGNVDYSVLMPHLKKLEDNQISWISFMSAALKLPRGDTSFSPLFLDKLVEYDIQRPDNPGTAIINSDFEGDSSRQQQPKGWQTWSPDGRFAHADYVEQYTGNSRLTHYAQTSYAVYTFQTIQVPNGTYRLSVAGRRQGTFQTSLLMAKHYGGMGEAVTPITDSPGWSTTTLDRIEVSNGQIEIGVYSVGSAEALASFDRFQLVRVK